MLVSPAAPGGPLALLSVHAFHVKRANPSAGLRPPNTLCVHLMENRVGTRPRRELPSAHPPLTGRSTRALDCGLHTTGLTAALTARGGRSDRAIHLSAPILPRITSAPLNSSAGRIRWQMLATYRVTDPGPEPPTCDQPSRNAGTTLEGPVGDELAASFDQVTVLILRRPAFSHEVLRTHRSPTTRGALISTGTVAGLLWSGRRASEPPTVHCV